MTWAVLYLYGVDEKLIIILKTVYENTKVAIRVEWVVETKKMSKKGWPYISKCHNIPRTNNAKNKRISTMDISTQAHHKQTNKKKLQESPGMLRKTAIECALKANINKTKVMLFGLKSLKKY